MAFTVSVIGRVETEKYKTLVGDAINRAIGKTVLAIEKEAKQNAWVDTGVMRASISSGTDPLNFSGTVTVQSVYAMIQEFGRAPGSKFPPLDAIRDWVRRHISELGISTAPERGLTIDIVMDRRIDSMAFLIGRAIAKKGITAQPFLFPAAESQRQPYLDAVTEAINQAIRDAA